MSKKWRDPKKKPPKRDREVIVMDTMNRIYRGWRHPRGKRWVVLDHSGMQGFLVNRAVGWIPIPGGTEVQIWP